MKCHETIASPLGPNQCLTGINVDTCVLDESSALVLAESIGKDLLYLIEQLEFLPQSEVLLSVMENAILRRAEELDERLETIAQRTESSENGGN